MSDQNHRIILKLKDEVGGVIYSCYGVWILKWYGLFFDHTGEVVNCSESFNKLPELPGETEIPEVEIKAVLEKIEAAREKNFKFILDQICSKLNIKTVSCLNEERVYCVSDIRQTEIEYLLVVIEKEVSWGSLSSILARYRKFSNMELCPKVIKTEIISDRVAVVLMECSELTTLEQLYLSRPADITDISDIINQAVSICYKIEQAGYWDVDNHPREFVYSHKNKTVYAVNFRDLRTGTGGSHKRFDGQICF